LIMNNESRYNFVIYGLVKADFKRMDQLIIEHLQENLRLDGADQQLIDTYINGITGIGYTPTSNRSIISQINEMIMVAGDELVHNLYHFNDPRPEEVNRMMNRYVFLKLPLTYSGKTMMESLGKLGGGE
jgi:hypothetical protein